MEEGNMMDDRNDINRPLGTDPYLDRRPLAGDGGYGWGIPLGIGAVVLIAGLLFFGSSSTDERSTTASNNAPATTQTNPSSPPRPAPPAAKPQ
jgi:hypothetical protein